VLGATLPKFGGFAESDIDYELSNSRACLATGMKPKFRKAVINNTAQLFGSSAVLCLPNSTNLLSASESTAETQASTNWQASC